MTEFYPDPRALSPAKFRTVPTDMPRVAWHESGFNNSWDEPCPVEDEQVFRRAYYSAVTYIDDMVGRVLKALDTSGLANDTIVSFHGDRTFSPDQSPPGHVLRSALIYDSLVLTAQ